MAKSKSEGATPSAVPAFGGLAAPKDHVFNTPGSILKSNKRARTKSLSVTFSAKASARKTPKANRCSLLLRQLSPEDGLVFQFNMIDTMNTDENIYNVNVD